MLEQLVLIVHALAAIAMVGLIMIQQGKGADMGASFGSGGSQTVLGVQGSGNLLTHATAIFATVFFVTSLTLAYFAKQQSMALEDLIDGQPVVEEVIEMPSIDDEIPVMTETQVSDEVPSLEETSEIPASEIPDAPDSEIPVK